MGKRKGTGSRGRGRGEERRGRGKVGRRKGGEKEGKERGGKRRVVRGGQKGWEGSERDGREEGTEWVHNLRKSPPPRHQMASYGPAQ